MGYSIKMEILPRCQPLLASPLSLSRLTYSQPICCPSHRKSSTQVAPPHEGKTHSSFSLLTILCSSLSLHTILVRCPTSDFTTLWPEESYSSCMFPRLHTDVWGRFPFNLSDHSDFSFGYSWLLSCLDLPTLCFPSSSLISSLLVGLISLNVLM